MYVYIMGGFLGSGKTTLLMKLASMYTKRGLKTALVVNESGSVGVDGATLKAEGYDAVELPDGCICCSLSGTLQSALKNIKKDIDPDIIIIEPTGLALPHKVKDLVRVSMIDDDGTFIIGVAVLQDADVQGRLHPDQQDGSGQARADRGGLRLAEVAVPRQARHGDLRQDR